MESQRKVYTVFKIQPSSATRDVAFCGPSIEQ